MDITRLKLITEEMRKALLPLEEKFGIKLQKTRCSYGTNNFKWSVEVAEVNANGEVQTKEREEYTKDCILVGLKKEWLDQTVTVSGTEYVIRGLNLRKSKFPVLVNRKKDNKPFCLTADSVKLHFMIH